FAAQVGTIVEILGPLPIGDGLIGCLGAFPRRSAVMKFPDRPCAAVGTIELKRHEDSLIAGLTSALSTGHSASPRGYTRVNSASGPSKERQILIHFPGRHLAVIAFPLAALQFDEFIGNHAQAGTDDGVALQFVDRFGQRLRESLDSALGNFG